MLSITGTIDRYYQRVNADAAVETRQATLLTPVRVNTTPELFLPRLSSPSAMDEAVQLTVSANPCSCGTVATDTLHRDQCCELAGA